MNFLAPLLTLVLCAGFLIFQTVSLRKVTTGNADLETRIGQAERSTAGANQGSDPTAAATKSGGRRGTGPAGTRDEEGDAESIEDIDLEDLARAIMESESRGALPDFEVMLRMQNLMLEATPEQLADLIQRTSELEVPNRVKENLIGELVSGLANHNPQLALEVAIQSPALDMERHRWRFSRVFAQWTRKDPLAAAQWYDRERAKGTFESKALAGSRDAGIEFESSLVGKFLESDPARARSRLESLSPQERITVLSSNHVLRFDEENAATYALLVRESVAENQRGEVFATAARQLQSHQGLQAVADFAEQIEATPAERRHMAERAAQTSLRQMARDQKKPTAESLGEMQSFLETQAPGETNRITGQALATYGGANRNMPAALDLLKDLHDKNPSDDLLVGFFSKSSRIRPDSIEAAADLVNRIQDPAQREEVLKNIPAPNTAP